MNAMQPPQSIEEIKAGLETTAKGGVRQRIRDRPPGYQKAHRLSGGKAKKPKPRQKSPEEQFQEAKNRCFRILADYLHLLMAWRTDYAPRSPEEAFHPRFVEALQQQAHVDYLLDVLLFGEPEEQAASLTDHGKHVIQLEQRMAELAAADAARTKKYHERHAAAPER